MDRSAVILVFAISILFVANITFSEVTYFYPLHLIILNLLGLISAALFFLAYMQRENKIKAKIKVQKYFLITLVGFFLLVLFQYVFIATLITIAALYIIAFASEKLKGARLRLAIAVIIIVAASLAFVSLSGLRGSNWKGIDEIAYNYYASYQLLHGVNPYKASMLPIITAHNITPTYQLNGTVETAYDYPALSFLPVLFLGLLTLHDFIPFIAVVTFIAAISAFIAFRSTKYNYFALIPITLWLLLTYFFIGTIDQYISVAIFLLLAYTERKNTILSAIFIGLSASVIQLSWFAIPFFFVLTYKEKGKRDLLITIGISLLVFLLANIYFIALGPIHFFENIFSLFGSSKLLLAGTEIMQVLVRSYGVVSWYPVAVSAIVLLSSLVLFYFYTKTLKPLMAIVPAFIFMLTWHNFLMYSLAYVPLFIIMCYDKGGKVLNDSIPNRIYIPVALAAIILISLALVVYAHGAYVKQNTLVIDNVSLSISSVAGTSVYNISAITLNITNNAAGYENVSIFMINRYPVRDAIFLAPNLTAIAPHSTEQYNLHYAVKNVTSNSSIYIMAFSTDYIKSAQFKISTDNGAYLLR